MPDLRQLRLLAVALRVVAAVALCTTAVVVLAVVMGGVNAPPGFPQAVVWVVALAGGTLLGLAGLLIALVFYVMAEAIAALSAIVGRLRREVARLSG